MKEKPITITILTNGDIQFLGDVCPLDLPLGKAVRRRVSTIRPTRTWRLIVFLILRRVCGEQGRVAAWTRTWTGPWRCRILKTGETAVFETRAEAIGWEIETINGHLPNIDL